MVARGATAATAFVLLLLPEGGSRSVTLGVVGLGYAVATIALVAGARTVRTSPLAWTADAVVTLVLIGMSASWRSPFYLLALTALVLPTTGLPMPRALAFGGVFTVGFVAASALIGIDWTALVSTPVLQSYVSHIAIPLLISFSLAYSSDLLRRLRRERDRAERLAIEAERRRIAWELHDSAKQRVHAAHLIVSSVEPHVGSEARQGLAQVLRELQAADADMETSLTELTASIPERSLGTALRARARELSATSDTAVEVVGEAPDLPAPVAAHVYRIASEALTNAMRHARASRIEVRIAGGDALQLSVIDDGVGIAHPLRPGAHGLRSMRSRAETIGAELEITPGKAGGGTRVALELAVAMGRGRP